MTESKTPPSQGEIAANVAAEGRAVEQLKLILEGFAYAVAVENEAGTEGLVEFAKKFRQIIEGRSES
jgi:hypothetical protein